MSSLNGYVVTFNCAREAIKPTVLAPYLLTAATQAPDLLVLCLQEIAPIGYAFLGGSFLSLYFNAFRQAVKLAGEEYVNVISRNIGLTAIMVFAKPDIASNVRSLQTAVVGLGVSEMGNKGAIGIRIGYDIGDGIMQMTFVSAHLAAAEDQLARRNQDYQDIVERLVFIRESKMPMNDEQDEETPLIGSQAGGKAAEGIYSTTSHLVFAGDLNYRTSLLSPSEEDRKTFPQPVKDESNPLHYSHLLLDDQLTRELNSNKTLHHLVEEPIDFPPTYKYHPRQDVTVDGEEPWHWASHRWPSWCDRIFRSQTNITASNYRCLPLFGSSDHRPVALSLSIPLKTVSNKDISAPFNIDPTWRARRDNARKRELVVGILAYLAMTREGNGLFIATTIGLVGGWFIMRSLLMS